MLFVCPTLYLYYLLLHYLDRYNFNLYFEDLINVIKNITYKQFINSITSLNYKIILIHIVTNTPT